MRILTLVAGSDSLSDARSLGEAIGEFNRTIDFRLRFLNIDIENSFAAVPGPSAELEQEGFRVHPLDVRGALQAAASLALLIDRERPALVLVTGGGELRDAGLAAAAVAGVKVALFGPGRGQAEDALDLGDDPQVAVERMTGVAREIR